MQLSKFYMSTVYAIIMVANNWEFNTIFKWSLYIAYREGEIVTLSYQCIINKCILCKGCKQISIIIIIIVILSA